MRHVLAFAGDDKSPEVLLLVLVTVFFIFGLSPQTSLPILTTGKLYCLTLEGSQSHILLYLHQPLIQASQVCMDL